MRVARLTETDTDIPEAQNSLSERERELIRFRL